MKRRILIVDDDLQLSRTLKLALDQTGMFEVRVENNATSAQRAAEEFRPDLILLDVIMPGMDGGSVAALLRENHRTKDIQIIFLTSILNKDEAASHGGRIGNDPVLAKPVALDDLLAEIKKLI